MQGKNSPLDERKEPMTDGEYQALIKLYRREARKLIQPSLRVVKEAIEDPNPHKAAANLRKFEKALGVKNLRKRIAEVYKDELRKEKTHETGRKRQKKATHLQASRPR